MQSIVEWLKDNPEFFKTPDDLHIYKKQTFEQCARHQLKDAPSDILRKKRPFETEEYQTYRDENRRLISAEGVWEFGKILIKALKQVHFDEGALPPIVQDRLKAKPYRSYSQRSNLQAWVKDMLIPVSLLDPNAITVDLPANRLEPLVPPSAAPEEGGVPELESLPVDTLVVCYDEYWVFPEANILAVQHLSKLIEVDKEMKLYPVFFIADHQEWFIYYPARQADDGEIEYAAELWYEHRLGDLPFNPVPSDTKLTVDKKIYRVSYIQPYFEWADEFDSRFQDDQVVHQRYAYPREVVASITCTTCKGTTKVSRKVGFDRKIQSVTCKDCHGTGKVASSSISGRLVAPEIKAGATGKPPSAVEFITPPTEIFKHTTENAFFFLEEGRKAIGVNPLTTFTESGEAKKVREENKVDKVLGFTYSIILWQEQHLRSLHRLTTSDIEEEITLQRPVNIAIKSEDALREDVSNALPVDLFTSTLKYIHEKYSGDPKLQKVHTLAILFAPLLMYTLEERRFVFEKGGYSEKEIRKADFAVYIFSELAKGDKTFMLTENFELLRQAENQLNLLYNESSTADPPKGGGPD